MGTHYYDPIDRSPGRLAGNSRKWGDAPADVKEAVVNMIINEGRKAGLSDRDIAILLAIAYVESGFSPDAAARTTTASGVGQFIDNTWKTFGKGDPFNAEANIQALVKEYLFIKENRIQKYNLTEDYIYKYHHDGLYSYIPGEKNIDYGGLNLSRSKVMPLADYYYNKLTQNASIDSYLNPYLKRANTNSLHTSNQYYIVQPGDTLSKIAKRYGVDLNDLINENRRRGLIEDPNLIYPGQRIYIPGYQEKVRSNVQEGSRRIDPLVIDLDGDGIKLVNINRSNAMFDLTGSGFANRTGWISGGDAFLVWDRNNDKRINDISEMFGNERESGFKALSLYDTNRDGKIDALDDVFKNLKLWQDRNGDGRTDEGELLSLSDVGIKSISLKPIQTNINQEGNTITEVGSVEFEDGKTTQAGNVNFELDRLYSYYNREVELNPEVVNLPWVRGYGFMPDLPVAMSLDNTLLQMVKDAVTERDLTKLKEKFEKIIFRWAGVENITDKEIGVSWAILSGNDREHRLLHFDGGITLSYEQVGALQKFVGMTPEEVVDTVRHRSGQYFLEAWNTMFKGLFTRFVVDAGLLEDILPAYYDFFTDKIIIDEEFDIKAYESQIKQMLSSQDTNQINLAFISMMVLKEINLLETQFINKLYTDFSKNLEIFISPYTSFLFKGIIFGTTGDDVLYGTEGDNVISGGPGNDKIYGYGGNDTLIGGPGNDYLEGGKGSDIYIFNKGDGEDKIVEWWDEPNKTNIVKFGESITKDDILFKREGEDLIVEIKDSFDRIKIFGWFVEENSPKIDRFEFPDGSIITKDEINNLENIKFSQIKGTDRDDEIYGSYFDEMIYGYGGNDYIYGKGGNDFINAGDGNDYISVNDGNSVIIGDKGNDYICLYGQGEKIVEFNKGDGIDTINLLIWGNSSLKIKFGEGISKDDLCYQLKEEGIFIGLKNAEEGIFIKLWAKKGTVERIWGEVFLIKYDYYTAGWSGVYNLVNKISIEFKDGSFVSGSKILESFAIKGTEENNNLYGTEEPDILIGKKGNDYLNGGSGRDLYIFNPGDGQDIVQNRESQGIYNGDILNFKTDKKNIVFFRDNNDLIIGYSNNDFVKVLDQFKDENSGIEKIEVKDGYYITRWDIENIVNAMIDFTNDKGMSYAEIYNNLLNNQNFNMLLSQNWSKSWVDFMGVT